MQRLALMAAVLVLGGSPAALAGEQADAARQAELATDLKPFDAMESQGWEAPPPGAYYRTVAEGEPDAVQLQLKPGAYMIVAKCRCDQMDVTLVAPDASQPRPIRSSPQAALFGLDVSAPGTYLVGVDMGACQAKSCDFAVKAYRKK